MAEKLKIIPLGGLNEIGKNMTVLEYGKDIIIVDCGLGFPDDEMYGVDLVIADMTYLVKNKDKIRGMFLTHGHEDHIGGIPYAMEQFRCPIHATRLTAGIVQLKLEEHQLQNAVHLFTHEAGEKVKAGCFTVEFIHVNHSIADAVAFAIKTPVGTVVMTGDFKIDATAVGGEILFVETSLSKGKGGKLTLTGNLGDVMKESAMLALEYLKAHTKLLNLQEDIFDNWNIHIHVPEGAIPKDGPSAGITMVTSLASALTQRKVKANLAMTGEITLRGKVLPVGGIKEKILAAKRAGIKDIILCEENRKNIEEIQPMYLEGLTFHYVTDIKEVLALALTNEKVNGAIDFNITNQKTEEKK